MDKPPTILERLAPVPDLTIIIPARNEMFLKRTVEDILEHAVMKTEVFVMLDGEWPVEPLEQNPRVHVFYSATSRGQRGMTNLGVKLATSRYVMKLDAHCSLSPGFDKALIDADLAYGKDDLTQIPVMFNLHVFNWKCDQCGFEIYQGPTPTVCVKCKTAGPFHREMVWERRKRNPRANGEPARGGYVRTDAWRFNCDMKFKYDSRASVPDGEGISDVMSSIGACWFMRRDRFFALDGFDEGHGSWGQYGTELACKSWLSGGRHVVNNMCWFAHLFRTQGGDFGFPYPLSGKAISHARTHSRRMWLNNAWPKQVHPLSWLVEKFKPVVGWHTPEPGDAEVEKQREKTLQHVMTLGAEFGTAQAAVTEGVVYYSDCLPEPWLLRSVQQKLLDAFKGPIVAVTLKPLTHFGLRPLSEAYGVSNIVLDMERGYLAMFSQILAGIKALETDVVYLCEHDVVYHPSHFEFTPPRRDVYWYNLNVWKADVATGRTVTYITKQTSGLCADRKLLETHYQLRVDKVKRDGFSRAMGFEPGSHGRAERVDDVKSDTWRSDAPNVDLRHTTNLTESRWSQDQFRSQRNCQGWTEGTSIPTWGDVKEFIEALRALGSA